MVFLQLSAHVVWHSSSALCIVGSLPPAVRLGSLDLAQACMPHLTLLDEFRGPLAVDLRPLTPWSTWCEPLQPVAFVKRGLLAIDPAVAERYLEGFRVGDGFDG